MARDENETMIYQTSIVLDILKIGMHAVQHAVYTIMRPFTFTYNSCPNTIWHNSQLDVEQNRNYQRAARALSTDSLGTLPISSAMYNFAFACERN